MIVDESLRPNGIRLSSTIINYHRLSSTIITVWSRLYRSRSPCIQCGISVLQVYSTLYGDEGLGLGNEPLSLLSFEWKWKQRLFPIVPRNFDQDPVPRSLIRANPGLVKFFFSISKAADCTALYENKPGNFGPALKVAMRLTLSTLTGKFRLNPGLG